MRLSSGRIACSTVVKDASSRVHACDGGLTACDDQLHRADGGNNYPRWWGYTDDPLGESPFTGHVPCECSTDLAGGCLLGCPTVRTPQVECLRQNAH